jgi:hypothetical protein
MVLAHVVAVVAAAVLIAAIDGAIWLLRALARQLLRAVTGLVAPALLRPVADLVGVATIGVLELGAIGRRGPPAAAAPV